MPLPSSRAAAAIAVIVSGVCVSGPAAPSAAGSAALGAVDRAAQAQARLDLRELVRHGVEQHLVRRAGPDRQQRAKFGSIGAG